MQKYLICIESFIGHSLDSLYRMLDDRDNAASRVGMLSYATEIQCGSRNDAVEILRAGEQDLNGMYRDVFEGKPWLAPLVPFEMEEVHDGYFECVGHRASIFWIESVSKIWTVSDISRARLEYNRWLHSDDELKDVPDNRPCVLLRFCEEHAKVRQSVLASIHPKPKDILQPESSEENEQLPASQDKNEIIVTSEPPDAERWYKKRRHGMTIAAIVREENIANHKRSGERKVGRSIETYAKKNNLPMPWKK